MIRLLICILGGGIQHDSSCLKQCENLDRELSYFWMKLDIRGIGFAMGDVAWTLLPRLNPGDFVFLSFGPYSYLFLPLVWPHGIIGHLD
jgi:hypothetical protein